MKPYEQMKFHPIAERLVDITCQITQNNDRQFFRLMVNNYLTLMPSMMQASVMALDNRDTIPVNIYSANLAPSGNSKGHSTRLMKKHVLHKFMTIFKQQTAIYLEEIGLADVATKRSYIYGTDPDTELAQAKNESKLQGELQESFSSATLAAIHQNRTKIQLIGVGAMNLEIDEIGQHITSSADALKAYLELYDMGELGYKLTKNTRENAHTKPLEGRTPANLIIFGDPIALLDGDKNEAEWTAFLNTGYARRFFFGYTRCAHKILDITPAERLAIIRNKVNNTYLDQLSTHFAQLADPLNHRKVIGLSDPNAELIIEYQMDCEKRAAALPEHKPIHKTELSHRYFKAMKLAGAYAFIDGDVELSQANIEAAIAMAEESGNAFNEMMARDKPFVKLAKYIASIDHPVTHPELTEDLPFYKGNQRDKDDMIRMAIAWGYKNQVIIKKSYSMDIEFLEGETLQPTDLNAVRLSVSNNFALNYQPLTKPFDKLAVLAQKDNLFWLNHHLTNGHRHGDNVTPGFNLAVFDVDGGVSMDIAAELLKEYAGLIYETKRSTPTDNRFRLILPLNYFLELDRDEFNEFMRNLATWLPFKVDDVTHQRARMWATYNISHRYLPGDKLVDVMDFIPSTSRNDNWKKEISISNFSNLERWFMHNTTAGNRNHQLLRYALMLVDNNKSFDEVRSHVIGLNNKLQNKLSDQEISSTILVTVSKAIAGKPKP